MKKISFNNIKIMAGLILAMLGIGSCKKLIEIPGNPPTEISQSQQFSDSASIMTAIAGVYSYTSYGVGFTYNDGLITFCTGLSSDEISNTNGDADYLEFFEYGLNPLNGHGTTLWSDPYAGLYPVNAILTALSGTKTIPASLRTQLTAELKVVRAFYYFNLVNVFGAVPLVTSIDYATTARLPRAAVDSVYDQILKDLTDAQQGLTADYPSSSKSRPNLYTALSLLAKVHLYRREWQAAYDAANTVIGSGVYALEPDLNKVFLDGSQEAIWQIPATGLTYGDVTTEANYFIPYAGNIPFSPLTPWLLNAFEPGDQRLQDWVGQTAVSDGTTTTTYYYPFKYKNVSASSPTTEDYMVFRLGEQYLIRAEAAAHLGRGGDALADVNAVRERAGLGASTADASDQAAVLNAIMHERQVELFTEWGNRWFDLKRTGTVGTVLSAEKTGWQAKDTLYPVPQSQRQLNNLLTQNPGYN